MPETGIATAKARLRRDLALPGRGGLGFRNVSQRIAATCRRKLNRTMQGGKEECRRKSREIGVTRHRLNFSAFFAQK